MKLEAVRPEDIERRSMEIIEEEMGEAPHLSKEEKLIVKRVIHTTADFDYLRNLKFSPNAVERGLSALNSSAIIVTDTNMALSGINKSAAHALGSELFCFMADGDVAERAKVSGTTRAVASMEKAAALFHGKNVIYAIGNAPTALIRLCELAREGRVAPSLVIGAPVGFVNVIQSKQMLMESGLAYIAADGRKGGSSVAAAICNALMYMLQGRK